MSLEVERLEAAEAEARRAAAELGEEKALLVKALENAKTDQDAKVAALVQAQSARLSWKVRYRTFLWFFSQMSKL